MFGFCINLKKSSAVLLVNSRKRERAAVQASSSAGRTHLPDVPIERTAHIHNPAEGVGDAVVSRYIFDTFSL